MGVSQNRIIKNNSTHQKQLDKYLMCLLILSLDKRNTVQNHFQVLQIDPEATDDELKKRFRAVSYSLHSGSFL